MLTRCSAVPAGLCARACLRAHCECMQPRPRGRARARICRALHGKAAHTPRVQHVARHRAATGGVCSALLQVLNVVHAHGGDVLKFAGDAVMALFKPSSPEVRAPGCLGCQLTGREMHEWLRHRERFHTP